MYVERDRTWAAQEQGYQTKLCQMTPWTCTAKYDMIAGFHP
jgi:hypothetical protein